MKRHRFNTFISNELKRLNKDLAAYLDADVILIRGPLLFGLDDSVRQAIENVKDKKLILAVVLETTGGFIEVAERIVNVFRNH